jgi:hypothetical protein
MNEAQEILNLLKTADPTAVCKALTLCTEESLKFPNFQHMLDLKARLLENPKYASRFQTSVKKKHFYVTPRGK